MTIVVDEPTVSPPIPQPGGNDGRLVAGRFRLLEPLGRGGMGRVYRGHDELLARPVAVKLIYDDSIIDSDLRHACALEARAAARLNHPGIVRILDSGFDDGHLYVVMSLAEGRTLAEIVRTDGPLPTVRALEIVMQVADALGAAHQEGIIHCDVKPSNLIVRPDGTVQLVDFGIARIAASTTSMDSSTLQGSAEYVAPEQVEGSDVDGRTDLYALGVVLYETLAGRTPFGGGTIASVLARRLVHDPPSLRDSVPDVPVVVDQVVRRMLARNPGDRFQTAGQLYTALATARTAAQAALLPPPPAAARLTATMPFPSGRPRSARGGRAALDSLGRARAWSDRQGTRINAAGERALVFAATAALVGLRYGRVLTDRARPLAAHLLAAAHLSLTHVLQRVRRPSLASGVGIAVVIGLLIGTAAARCNVVSASADTALGPEVSAAAVSTQPVVPILQPASLVEPTAGATATASPPTPTPLPTAEPEPTVVVEPTAPTAPVQPAAQPPVQVVQPVGAPLQPAPSQQQPAAQEKKPDTPAAKPMSNSGPPSRGNEKQDEKPKGNNSNGNGQKKR